VNRLTIKLSQWRRRLLLLCSGSYRKHDSIVEQLRIARIELAQCREDFGRQLRRADELLKEGQQLSERLSLALAAQESATSQLIAERALRQAAEDRADQYHQELTEALKSSTNWTCRAMGKKAMFAEVSGPEPEPVAEKRSETLGSPKVMARQEASRITNATFAELWDDLRKNSNYSPEEQIGPEASSA
jgi:hypothetical protein